MTTRDSLLAAVLAAWEDDTPRLIYADWLEENENTVICRRCAGKGHLYEPLTRTREHSTVYQVPVAVGSDGKIMCRVDCPECSGSGRRQDGSRELAEFIRLQCEVARTNHKRLRHEDGTEQKCCSYDCPACRLDRRSQELLGDHFREWLEPSGMGVNDLMLSIPVGRLVNDRTVPTREIGFARGFADSVCCSGEDWVKTGDFWTGNHPVRSVRLTTTPRIEQSPHSRYLWRFVEDYARKEMGEDRILKDVSKKLRPGEPSVVLFFRARWPTVAEWTFSGPDSQYANTTHYGDGMHSTPAGEAILAEALSRLGNGLG